MANKAPAIGIDLGTTYSCVAVWQYGVCEVITNDQGNQTTPSFVAFTENERLIGEAAKTQVAIDPENTVYDAKRLIGRNYADESVQQDRRHFTFTLVNEGGKPKIEVEYKGETKRLSPEEISSMVLTKMKSIAENYLGQPITNAVVTVPAYFNDAQRKATLDAGKIAGLNVLRILNEPTAAAIAYGLDKKTQGEKNVLIFDLGGGTFDVTILSIDKGVFEVKSTAGDTHLGGEDFDSRLVMHFLEEFKQRYNKDFANDKRAVRRLRTACEQAKLTLSSATLTQIEIAGLYDGIDFKTSITRAQFEELCSDLFESTLGPVEKALEDAVLGKVDIHEIILVGGSSRIPKIQRLLKEFFNGKELNRSINPDEAVAYGAAVQAAILNGDEHEMLQDLLLLDVTPLSLGVKIQNGQMAVVIPRNTAIPAKRTKLFSTSHDDQTVVLVEVFQGERPLVKNNQLLGRFQLRDIPKAPSRVPQITVTFQLDVNGILSVTAENKSAGIQSQIKIEDNKTKRAKEDIERMVRESEEYRRQDEENIVRINALEELRKYGLHIKSTINQDNFKLKVTNEDWEKASNKVEEVFNWIENHENAAKEDHERMLRELEAVTKPVIDKYKANIRNNRVINAARAPKANENNVNQNERPGVEILELN